MVWRGWYLNWVTRRSEDSPPGRKVCCGCQKGEQAQARGSSGKQHWRVQPEVGVAAETLKSWLRPVLGGLAKLEASNIPSASTAAPASARVCCGAGDTRGRRAGVSPALHGPVLREDGTWACGSRSSSQGRGGLRAGRRRQVPQATVRLGLPGREGGRTHAARAPRAHSRVALAPGLDADEQAQAVAGSRRRSPRLLRQRCGRGWGRGGVVTVGGGRGRGGPSHAAPPSRASPTCSVAASA